MRLKDFLFVNNLGYENTDLFKSLCFRYKLFCNSPGYCSDVRQSSGNHAPKCLPFSILCAKSVIIHTTIACMPIKTGVGVNL